MSLFCISLIFLHILAFIFGVVQSPEMFHTSMPLGAMCKGQELETFNSIESSRSSCEPVTLFQKVDRLDELTFTFRFPSEETKVVLILGFFIFENQFNLQALNTLQKYFLFVKSSLWVFLRGIGEFLAIYSLNFHLKMKMKRGRLKTA